MSARVCVVLFIYYLFIAFCFCRILRWSLNPKPQNRSGDPSELPLLMSVRRTRCSHVHEIVSPRFFHICRLDVQYETIDYLYTPTYTRIGAYFIGVLAGWYLSHYDRKMDISKVFMLFAFMLFCFWFLWSRMHHTIVVWWLRHSFHWVHVNSWQVESSLWAATAWMLRC